jgi:KDO transferase-3
MGRGYFCGRTIAYLCVQLAYTLGFRKVFIVGMDLKNNAGRFYEESKDALPTSLDDDYDGFILPSFAFMQKRIAAKENFQVFNLSSQSRLPDDILPKINLNQLDQLLASKE